MNFGQLKSQVLQNLGEDSSLDSLAGYCVNSTLRLLSRLGDWKELEKEESITLTVGQSEYDLSSLFTDFYRLYDLTLITSSGAIPLGFMSPKKWDEEIAPQIPTASNGKPSVYTQWGLKVKLFRPPDSNYTLQVRYRKLSRWLTSDNETPELNMDEVVVAIATSLMWLSREDDRLFAMWFKLGSQLAEAYGIKLMDVKDLINPQEVRKIAQTGEYWLNPFVKEVE